MASSVSTKEELLSEIQRLQNLVVEQEDLLNKQKAAVQTGKRGWMISTPNPGYTGKTNGIWFDNGHAFIPADRVDAKKILASLTIDFGYSATEVDGGVEVDEPPKTKKKTVSESLMQPHVMNKAGG